MTAGAVPGRFAVDAGGSHTRALVVPAAGAPSVITLPSVNPHATGAAANHTLVELLAEVRARLGPGRATGWLASASVAPDRLGTELTRVRAAAERAGLAADVLLSNDIVPLLWGVPALAGTGAVVVCGTGSGFFGADGCGRVVKAGGWEYLGSDEGGAVDIGWRGLRAAVRATDGRGPATGLVAAFQRATGDPVTTLAARLAADPFPKQGLAELAPIVRECWLSGDPVAAGIAERAVRDLVDGVRAVRDGVALPAGFAVAAAGGVFTGCPELYRELAGQLVDRLGAGGVHLVTDTLAVVLAALEKFRAAGGSTVPAGFDPHIGLLAGRETPRRQHVAGTVLGRVR